MLHNKNEYGWFMIKEIKEIKLSCSDCDHSLTDHMFKQIWCWMSGHLREQCPHYSRRDCCSRCGSSWWPDERRFR